MKNDKKQLTELELIETIKGLYPLLEEKCETEEVITFKQEEFAEDYRLDGMLKLGMIIKFAGLFDKEVRIINKKDGNKN